ncbi:MAG: hypothetical protein PHY48_05800 [Candidatus Cloacimonetes bacterium]|nr:hypothetical protein [Candidatus Cloacimonadota bacterium]
MMNSNNPHLLLTKLRLRVLSLLLALCIVPLLLSASISQELAGADSLNVGTPFTFIIHSSYTIKEVPIPDTLESFTIIQSQKTKDDKTWQLTIVPLKTGALSFPRLQVQPVDSDVESGFTDAFRVYVLSVLAEGDTLLRDIKPLERYPWQPSLWLYILLALLGLGLAIYLFIKRQKPKPPQPMIAAIPVPKQIPAWEVALASLETLLAENLLESGEVLKFHFRISDILRAFLVGTYHFPALEMTVSEIVTHINKRHISHKDEIRSFLAFCDMVKFAKAEPTAEEIQQRVQWLTDYLQGFNIKVTKETK